MLAVSTAIVQTCQLDRSSSARWRVSAQNSATAVHPPYRCVTSNTLCARLRTPGEAQTTTATARAARQQASTTVVSEAGPTRATTVNAHSHAVPASAAPTWMPPMWCNFDTLQRTHSGQVFDPRPASP
jgi:hypothetical protein